MGSLSDRVLEVGGGGATGTNRLFYVFLPNTRGPMLTNGDPGSVQEIQPPAKKMPVPGSEAAPVHSRATDSFHGASLMGTAGHRDGGGGGVAMSFGRPH